MLEAFQKVLASSPISVVSTQRAQYHTIIDAKNTLPVFILMKSYDSTGSVIQSISDCTTSSSNMLLSVVTSWTCEWVHSNNYFKCQRRCFTSISWLCLQVCNCNELILWLLPLIVVFTGFHRVNLNRVALEEGEEQEVGLLLNPVSTETLQRKRMTSTVRR